MRYRNRVRIAKGLYVNLSGSGASLSIGTRGASVTFGKKGTYLNTGLPGTGLYNRQKIGNSNQPISSGHSSIKSSPSKLSVNVELTLDEKANPLLRITDSFGNEIKDEAIIRKVKREEHYKKSLDRLMNEKRAQIEENILSFIEIFKSTPRLLSEERIRNELNSLYPQKYNKQNFTEPTPSLENIKLDLENEARQKIKKLLFWKNKKCREEYVNCNIQQRYQEITDKWKARRDTFNAEQERIGNEKNEFYFNKYTEKKTNLENYLTGTASFISSRIETLLNEITLPVDFSIDYEYNEDKSTLFIDLDLPEIEDMPISKVSTLASGKISIKEKPQKELKRDYALCVCGLAFYFGGLFFNISSKITTIQISGYSQRVNRKNGEVQDEYIYSVKFDRMIFETLKINKIDPVEAISNFENRLNINSVFDLKTIEPFTTE
jgi:hypothetical protein